ncbi:MAG TPA: glycosyl hydrolase family 18 protein [Drouetiella sp.]
MANSKRKFAITFIAVVLFVLAACLIDNANFRRTPIPSLNSHTFENGLWLRYHWYAGKHVHERDWQAMLQRLRDFKIRYAYFHVLTTRSDGSLKMHKLENALKITSRVHTNCPGTKAIAWVYVAAPPQQDGSDLNNPAIRKTLVDQALWLVNDCGFDGVQWDYEFCTNDNAGLLKLLEETRSAIPKEKMISVDTPMYYPGILWGWSDDYFKKIAAKCDQICVMSYDSYLYSARAYSWLVSEQVKHVSNDVFVSNRNCKIVFGLPTYEDKTLAHNHTIESLNNALRGFANGYENGGAKHSQIEGVALFADYTTDEREWANYSRVLLTAQ